MMLRGADADAVTFCDAAAPSPPLMPFFAAAFRCHAPRADFDFDARRPLTPRRYARCRHAAAAMPAVDDADARYGAPTRADAP